jgi:polyisoprenoid-binding protein YceI
VCQLDSVDAAVAGCGAEAGTPTADAPSKASPNIKTDTVAPSGTSGGAIPLRAHTKFDHAKSQAQPHVLNMATLGQMSRKRQQSVLNTAVEALTHFGQTAPMTHSNPHRSLPWLFLALTLAFGSIGAPRTAGASPHDYRYDPVHSQILFSIDHDGFSRPFGRLHITRGSLQFDPADWSQSHTELDIDISGLDMGDAAWNEAVCKASLLDCKHYATAHFVSTSVEQKDATNGVLHGTLTLHGVSKPIDVPFRVNRVGETIYGMHTIAGFSATATLDRTDFGVTAFSHSIGHSVVIWMELEAIRDSQSSNNEKDSP